MRRVSVLSGVLVLALSLSMMTGTAFARKAPKKIKPAGEPTPTCVVRSLPSFTDQGEFAQAGSVADIVEVSCAPVYDGKTIKLSANELYNRCKQSLSWSSPFPYTPSEGPSFTVTLDDAGNATAALWAGPSCASGESLITAHLEEAPYETFTTAFVVLPPKASTPGVIATPSSQVEDDVYSSIATVVQVEFPPVYAERPVDISAEQLYARCLIAPHLVWVGPDETVIGEEEEATLKVKLDNTGSAFVVVLGGASCASGPSEIEASLEQAPYTTYTTSFTVDSPL
jgi:hypothetical protein